VYTENGKYSRLFDKKRRISRKLKKKTEQVSNNQPFFFQIQDVLSKTFYREVCL